MKLMACRCGSATAGEIAAWPPFFGKSHELSATHSGMTASGFVQLAEQPTA
jgi:hypothetical protein